MNGAATATMLDAALVHAGRGWPVFPCHIPTSSGCSCKDGKNCKDIGKHPKITDWPNQGTTDPATIRQWWARWPSANIGIVTGERSGFFVLDVDPRHGGDDTLRGLEAQHGPLPATVENLTGGGGRHIFFRYQGPVKTGASVLGPGLDIKSDGGFIVVPSSLHVSGRRYEWEASSHPDDVAIAKASAWLLAMLTAKSNGTGQGRRTQADWLALLQGAPDGTRYDVAQKLAGHFLGLGRPVEEVEALILGYLSQCDPPGDAEERDKARRMVWDFAAKDAAAGAAETQNKPDDAVIIRLADVKPEPVTWLWQERIALGKLTIIDGDPGLGKSALLLDLIARVSRGLPMPDGFPSLEGGAVILTLEDGLADTVRPRLDVAGADVTRVVALSAVRGADGQPRIPTLEDIGAIAQACRAVDARLVVIDPFMGYLPSSRNSWRDQDVRRALGPLAKMAEELGAAVVLIRHLNKASGSAAIYRGGGSIGISGACREAFLVAKDPEAADRYVMACVKTNLAKDPPALRYRTEGVVVEGIGEIVRIVWEGVSPHTADELLAAQVPHDQRPALEEAKEFLQESLSKGPVAAKQIQRFAKEAGIADKTLRRAQQALGIQRVKRGFTDGWDWKLPEDGQNPPKVVIQNDDHLRHEMTIFEGEVAIL